MTSQITTSLGPKGLEAVLLAKDGASLTVPLTRTHAERELSDLHLLWTAAGSLLGRGRGSLGFHLEEHFSFGSRPDGACEWCKLQGKILAAEGRKRLGEVVHIAPHYSGKVEIRRGRGGTRGSPGISGKALEAALRRSLGGIRFDSVADDEL